jgi:4-amino-4-deoxy-L-arabinose transferase-like glycosyltransferase
MSTAGSTTADLPEARDAVGTRRASAVSRTWRSLVSSVRRIPAAGRWCFLIALVNAAVWGVVVPPFQVPDEITHFAYAQYLAESGKPPSLGHGEVYSPQEQVALDRLWLTSVIGYRQIRGVVTKAEDQSLRRALATNPSPLSDGGGNPQANQPPLYYALAAVPYWLSPSQGILSRLAVMRLLSALMAAATVLTVFMFLRELFPASRWAWTVGALVLAFQPMFNFIAAGVQGDNLLYLTSALIFFALMRAYRRGLTRRRAAAIGAITAAGLLSKLTFVGLVSGIGLAVLLLVWRASREDRREALRMLVIATAIAVIPLLAYAVLNVSVWHRGSPTAGGLAAAGQSTLRTGQVVSLRETLDYTWQLYLPRLPFMHRVYFPGEHPITNLWLNGSIGRFGWLDYGFPRWVYTVGKCLVVVFVVLALVGLARLRNGLKSVLPIFACFAVMALGVLGEIGWTGIRYRFSTGIPFEQARYLFPLLALYATFMVLVARGAGRRWAPVLGAALVMLAMAHGLFAETLTISRYYG